MPTVPLNSKQCNERKCCMERNAYAIYWQIITMTLLYRTIKFRTFVKAGYSYPDQKTRRQAFLK